ncbi:MAG: alpha-ketoglutarate-dependent dioxygenase AlkB family protein [Lishizhenia sp.]
MLLDLFDVEKKEVENGWYIFHPHFLSAEESNHLFNHLHSQLSWKGGEIVLFGKKHKIPRKEVYFSDHQKEYAYAGKKMEISPWNSSVDAIRERLNKEFKQNFNACLCNLYENGLHSNGWHADNEKELGLNPVIASLSLGVTRKFSLKHNQTKNKLDFQLNAGSLLIMGGEMQHYYKHTVPKQLKVNDPRINLTFRRIV